MSFAVYRHCYYFQMAGRGKSRAFLVQKIGPAYFSIKWSVYNRVHIWIFL
jgi:hypothetical protein